VVQRLIALGCELRISFQSNLCHCVVLTGQKRNDITEAEGTTLPEAVAKAAILACIILEARADKPQGTRLLKTRSGSHKTSVKRLEVSRVRLRFNCGKRKQSTGGSIQQAFQTLQYGFARRRRSLDTLSAVGVNFIKADSSPV